ncbi:CARDB domain-containing protein [Pelagibius sp.]|uniref:CARDB domain-containing protein n=1 Tax=Pelagibius sp. TaxID=1931238 RepID=UPI002639952F|nr:CARDB domain-containing protein [Pelagibius sp.]
MRMNVKLAGAAAAAVAALSLALPGGASAQLNAPGGLTVGKPDITISVGYIGNKNWVGGGVVVLDDMGPVIQTQAGPNQDMCRFVQMDYQPGNQGDSDAGASTTKVYRDKVLVGVHPFGPGYLAANSWRPFKTWQMDLREGMNTVDVVMDANKQVSESNENNTFTAKLNVKLDCDGDGKINGVGGFETKPSKPGPGGDPIKSRKLRVQPRG